MRKKGSTANVNDTATLSGAITVTGTSTVIAAANPDRIFFEVHNKDGNEAVWIKLQPASVDNDKKGIFLTEEAKDRPFWRMPADNIYTGEISAIRENSNIDVYVTEY